MDNLKTNYESQRIFTPNCVEKESQEILEKVLNPFFNPNESAFLAINIDKECYNNLDVDIKIESWEPNEIVLTSTSDKERFIVLSEVYYPGWKVKGTFDNKIYMANGLLRAIKVPAGKTRILMKFDPYELKLGMIISSFSLFLIILLLFIPAFYDKKNI